MSIPDHKSLSAVCLSDERTARALTIVVAIDKCDGNVELVYPVGYGPPCMCAGSQEVGDRILRATPCARQAVSRNANNRNQTGSE